MTSLLQLSFQFKPRKNAPRIYKNPINYDKIKETLIQKKNINSKNNLSKINDNIVSYTGQEINNFIQNPQKSYYLIPKMPKIHKSVQTFREKETLPQFQDLKQDKINLNLMDPIKIKDIAKSIKLKKIQNQKSGLTPNVTQYLQIIQRYK